MDFKGGRTMEDVSFLVKNDQATIYSYKSILGGTNILSLGKEVRQILCVD